MEWQYFLYYPLSTKDAIERDSILETYHTLSKGNLEEGFASSDQILQGEMRLTGGQEHFYLETQSCLVVPKGEDGEMEIFCSSQGADHVQVRINRDFAFFVFKRT